MPGLDGYVSPLLRCAVFRRQFPGVQIDYAVIPIEEAFPEVARAAPEGCPPPTHAVRCTAMFIDGTWVEAEREIDLAEQGRDRKWRAIEQTPEHLAKISTKAMGRMLTRAGIPQKDYELQTLMRWLVALDGRPVAQTARVVDTTTGEIHEAAQAALDRPAGAYAPIPDDDPVDADDDTVTPVMALADRFRTLPGPLKATASKWGRERGITNFMSCPPALVDEANAHLDELEEQ